MWKEESNCLSAKFQFNNFVEAFAFMTRVAIIAEKMNHHPEWTNIYNVVYIKFTTHDAGSTITQLDRQMALEIDKMIY
jgi:4a-hydroxytetrahydrobiopterin dehydratase